MSRRLILLTAFAGLLAAPGRAEDPGTRVTAVLAEFDRLAAMPLWPGFSPAQIPLEIFDGRRTWLVRHPAPPAEFGATGTAARPDVLVFEGRHATVRANTSVDIGGVATASASIEGRTDGPASLAGLVLHEAFHVFQSRRHPKWGGNEGELFVYPVEDEEALALRRIESRSLTIALEAREPRRRLEWAARALESRRRRFARLPAGSSAYERGTESKEGLARYIEALASGATGSPIPAAEFAAARVRERAYASGSAIALLLDALEPRWKEGLESRDEPLDEILARAVGDTVTAVLPPREEAAIRRKAAVDAKAWTASRESLRREFFAAPGWRVVVESPSPLFPQGFDPLNVERLPAREVLHTRWVKLGNAEGALEVLDRRCLTEGAGKHPLFEGVKRATVAGLPEEPRPDTAGGGVRWSAGGVTLAFRAARVSRDGRTITVEVGAPSSLR